MELHKPSSDGVTFKKLSAGEVKSFQPDWRTAFLGIPSHLKRKTVLKSGRVYSTSPEGTLVDVPTSVWVSYCFLDKKRHDIFPVSGEHSKQIKNGETWCWSNSCSPLKLLMEILIIWGTISSNLHQNERRLVIFEGTSPPPFGTTGDTSGSKVGW